MRAWTHGCLVLLIFLMLAIGYSLTRAPWWDEGLFADVALSFRHSGRLYSTVLAPHSYLNFPGIDHYTYWQFPLYLASLGIWFHLAPGTVEWMRIFSVLWGCVYLSSWFLFVRALSRNETLALLVGSVVALDYSCIAAASNGRMEMMCAALGQAALATYVSLRDVNRNLALLLAGLFGSASFCCHPMGAVTSAFLLVIVLRDWREMSFFQIAAIALPYFAGAGLCLVYILQAPELFLAQARAASSYRVGGLELVVKNVGTDLYTRYFPFYFERLSGLARLKACALVFGAAGVVAITLNRSLRSNSLARTLLMLSAIGYLGVAAIDDMKFPYYLVYVTPFFSACGALWIWESFRLRGAGRLPAGALLFAYSITAIVGFGSNIYRDDFTNEFKPAVASVRRALSPGGVVIGPAQLGFTLGFGPPLIDDCYLGYVSGIQPQVYVMHNSCGPPRGPQDRWLWSRKILATHYHLVFANNAYWIYVKNAS